MSSHRADAPVAMISDSVAMLVPSANDRVNGRAESSTLETLPCTTSVPKCSACATCDGFFFRGKEVCIVGGGNTAVEEAIFLTHHANKVTLIHRRDTLRAEKIMQDRLFANPKISFVWDSAVEEVLGEGEPAVVRGVKLRNVKTGALSEVKCDGLFVAIGHTPSTELFKGKLEMDGEGYLITKADSTATAIPGVFAAGDVKDRIFRQAVTAAGMGCMAALEADRFLALAGTTGADGAEEKGGAKSVAAE